MMTITRRIRGIGAASAVAFLFAVSTAPAQQPQIVRGTIERLDGPTLFLKEGEGPAVAVKLSDNLQVFGVKPATIADVRPNDFIGVGALAQPDGSQKAIQVTIFAESQRGTGEGFRPWDRPGSTMTNGTVAAEVASVDGQVVTVKYKGGQQKIIIGPDAKIRMYVPGSRDELKPGAHVSIFRPEKAPDGSLQTARINVGLDGFVP